jgi:Tripartite tricarboxylate transporter TctB family
MVKNGKDFWAGLMFLGFGLGFGIVGYNSYNMGTAVRMGPAYFPAVLGGLMTVLGAIIFLRSFVSRIKNPLAVFPFRLPAFIAGCVLCAIAYYFKQGGGFLFNLFLALGLIVLTASIGPRSLWIILAGVIVFAFLLKPLGLAMATVILIFISAYGGNEFKSKEALYVSIVLVIFAVVVFVKFLGLPFGICPEVLDDACRKIGLGQ